jgi:hypothetical protein
MLRLVAGAPDAQRAPRVLCRYLAGDEQPLAVSLKLDDPRGEFPFGIVNASHVTTRGAGVLQLATAGGQTATVHFELEAMLRLGVEVVIDENPRFAADDPLSQGVEDKLREWLPPSCLKPHRLRLTPALAELSVRMDQIHAGGATLFGFESGLAGAEGWASGASSTPAWSEHTGPTPSSGTGPAAAHGGTGYLYTETSDPRGPGDTFGLTYDGRACTGQASLVTFWYSMHGGADPQSPGGMGTLRLRSTDANGVSVERWNKTGDQGAAWQQATVTLMTAAFAFEVSMPETPSYTSDAAVDDVSVTCTIPCAFADEPTWATSDTNAALAAALGVVNSEVLEPMDIWLPPCLPLDLEQGAVDRIA